MSKWDKLLAKICTLSKGVRFDEPIKWIYVEQVKKIIEREEIVDENIG